MTCNAQQPEREYLVAFVPMTAAEEIEKLEDQLKDAVLANASLQMDRMNLLKRNRQLEKLVDQYEAERQEAMEYSHV